MHFPGNAKPIGNCKRKRLQSSVTQSPFLHHRQRRKTPHFDEKYQHFLETERKFWQKHFENFGFLGKKN